MTFVKKYSTLLLFALILISCDSTDPWEFVPPDFSSVPARFDISGIEPTEIDEGVTAYIIERGESSPFFVTRRDIAIVKVTLRTVEGDIIFSTYANDRDQEIGIRVADAGTVMQFQGRQTYHQDFLNSPGLQKGLLGMKEGEIRTLIVEPEQGYKNTAWAIPNEEYRNSTLVYDIHIMQIEPS
ncbi:MAG TPA: FKBP-type peptidyl-prolyl cis-trans isomerase [Balneolaceae bacterium]|nr:FKBP-type peptidyl-prolyl cis-trans isomerase [Balneolaceae bacterium]